MTENWTELQLIALSPSASQEGQFVVVLATVDEQRRLPIIIGKPEAQAIAVAVEQLQPTRPLPYDSWLASLAILGSRIDKVKIERVEEGIFYAHLVITDQTGQVCQVDIRPSDALALAARCQARIYATEAVLQHASFQQELLEKLPKKGSLANYSLAELEVLLEKLLAKEDYQSAARIRDFIEKRKNT